jgi:hypothetical protein
MTCDRAAELLSDDLEGALDGVLATELLTHLSGCDECRALRAALVDVTLLLRVPALEPGVDLAERVARASWAAGRAPIVRAERSRAWANAAATWAGWLTEVPFAVQAVAAGFALVLTAGLVMAAGSPPGAARPRVSQRLTDAAVYVLERKDRLVEDFRLLRVVVGTAFEGRVDRVNDRVDDYRRLLDRRQKDAPPKGDGTGPNKKSEAATGAARWADGRPVSRGKTSEPASPAARRSV